MKATQVLRIGWYLSNLSSVAKGFSENFKWGTTPNDERKTIFGEKPPLICLCKAGTLKDYLIRTKITNRHQKSKSAQFNGKHCQVCQYIKETCEFEDADENKYDIGKGVIIATQILLFVNFTVALVLNNTQEVI